MNQYSATFSSWDTRTTPSGHDSPLPNLLGNPYDKEIHQPLSLSVEPILPNLQAGNRHKTYADDYCTYRLVNRSTQSDETVSSYVSKIVKEVKLQMKAHVSSQSNSTFFIRLLATYKLACNTNNIYEGADMWVRPSFAKNVLATTLNNRMLTAAHIPPDVVSDNTTKPTIQKNDSSDDIWKSSLIF